VHAKLPLELRCAFREVILTDIGDHDLHAGAQKHPRHAKADPAGTAGDESHFARDLFQGSPSGVSPVVYTKV
jgi:hypothetical protein